VRARSDFEHFRDTREQPFTRWRLAGFLALHFLSLVAQILAIVNFAFTQDWYFFTSILSVFLLSGTFCAHAAWHCDVRFSGSRCLPLKSRSLPVALLLALPYGFGQLVVVQMAIDDFMASQRRHQDSVEGTIPPTSLNSRGKQSSNRFHCKAVMGIVESLPSCAVVFYAFWSMNYPLKNPITTRKWTGECELLSILAFISIGSSSLGLLELDFCSSKMVAKRMRRDLRYELLHLFFRFTEVGSRVAIHIFFMIVMRQDVPWWWVPLGADFFFTFVLVTLYGGAEKNMLVHLLGTVPCTFANVFLFIDSPIKRRAASRLTRWLTCKHAVTLVGLPLLMIFFVENLTLKLHHMWELKFLMISLSILSTVLYWLLLWWVTSRYTQRHTAPDIFTACARGSLAEVRSTIRDLTHSAAVGLNVNVFDTDGNTPLMLAAANGHARVCKLLLEEGAQVQVKKFGDSRLCMHFFSLSIRRRWTALHMAAFRGHVDVVEVLLDGFDNARSRNSRVGSSAEVGGMEEFHDDELNNPLHVAAQYGQVQCALSLMGWYSDWACERNSSQLRPVDLAPTEPMRRSIESGHAPTHLPIRRASSGLPRFMDDLPSPMRAALQTEAWPQVRYAIRRSSTDMTLTAPGLCSYIASICGGAVGRVFLTDAGAHEECRSILSDISEAPETDGPSFVTIASQATVSLLPGQEVLPPPPPPSSKPIMEEIEPINSKGEPVQRVYGNLPDSCQLGEGSYGVVWRARDRRTNTWYAVKNIRTRRGAASIAMRECEVADHIRLKPHPCLVELFLVHDFSDAGFYALVMEFCPGGDLRGRIKALKTFVRHEVLTDPSTNRQREVPYYSYSQPADAMQWIGQVYLGLEHMHLRMETLLRDLKPENVVLTAEGNAKLTDFGFGRFGVESPGCWSFGIPTGSPGYVAPEILRQEESNVTVDLYSLGVLTWVLLTGGLTWTSEPVPPLGKAQHGRDFQAHFDDCVRLQRCLTHPKQNFARPLVEDASDFVTRLTYRNPKNRMRHTDIRGHAFIQPVQLPDLQAPPDVVKSWCHGTRSSTTDSATSALADDA